MDEICNNNQDALLSLISYATTKLCFQQEGHNLDHMWD